MSEKATITAMREWLKTCPLIAEEQGENGAAFRISGLSPEPVAEFSIEDSPTDPVTAVFFSGRNLAKSYIFISRRDYSEAQSVQIASSGFFEQLTEWVLAQNDRHHLPRLGGSHSSSGGSGGSGGGGGGSSGLDLDTPSITDGSNKLTDTIDANTAKLTEINKSLAKLVKSANALVLSDNMAVSSRVAASGTAQVAAAARSYREGEGNTNITQNIYSKAHTAADLQREARWEADRAKAQSR